MLNFRRRILAQVLSNIENVSYKTDSIGRVCRTYERHMTKRATDRDDARGVL